MVDSSGFEPDAISIAGSTPASAVLNKERNRYDC